MVGIAKCLWCVELFDSMLKKAVSQRSLALSGRVIAESFKVDNIFFDIISELLPWSGTGHLVVCVSTKSFEIENSAHISETFIKSYEFYFLQNCWKHSNALKCDYDIKEHSKKTESSHQILTRGSNTCVINHIWNMAWLCVQKKKYMGSKVFPWVFFEYFTVFFYSVLVLKTGKPNFLFWPYLI